MSEPKTPDERTPQDPGTSGLPSDAEPEADGLTKPEDTEDEPGTDARGRQPRYRENDS
jgi:hypothetical protein